MSKGYETTLPVSTQILLTRPLAQTQNSHFPDSRYLSEQEQSTDQNDKKNCHHYPVELAALALAVEEIVWIERANKEVPIEREDQKKLQTQLPK
jgi:hypothetical protein